MPKVRLQRARIGALVAKTNPAAWRSMCGCTSKPMSAAMPARSISLARPAHRVTICHELSDSDQIIKSEHGGTD